MSYAERTSRALALSKLLAASDGSFTAVKEAARTVELWEDRHPARAGAELLIASRAPGWETIAKYLVYRSVSDRDPVRTVLRPALKRAMQREGIPPWVERLARQFYEKP